MPEENLALTPQTQPPAEDYDAIQEAVMETARGRWFLREYARRNRNADTTLLLAAIERMEAALRIQTAIPVPSHPAQSHPPAPSLLFSQMGISDRSPSGAASSAHQLHELRDAITLTRESLPGPGEQIAADVAGFSRIATGVELMAARIRSNAEQVQETAWSLRDRAETETGADKATLGRRCRNLEAQARELSASSAQLEELSASAAMVAALLAEIEVRLEGMIGAQQSQADAPAQPVAAKAPSTPAEPAKSVQAQTIESKPSPAAAESPAPQPVVSPPPQAAPAPAPVNPNWMDTLAPRVRARNVPDPSPSAVDFNFHDEPQPAVALPNPAMREMALPADPVPPRAEVPAAPIVEAKTAEALFAEALTTGGGAPNPVETPAAQKIQIVKVADPLAPIMALSDEERIALFS